MKILKLFLAVSAISAGLALHAADPVHFYWTGIGGDLCWSNPDNWQGGMQPPKNGAETSVLHFPANSVSSNDYATCNLRELIFDGSGESVVTGGKISFDNGGDMIYITDSTVIISNDVVNNWGSRFYCGKGELIFAGEVTMRSTAGGRTLDVVTDGGNKPEAKVRFLNGLRSTDATSVYRSSLNYGLGWSDDPGKTYHHHLESVLQLKNLTIGANYHYVELYIDAPYQDWETANVINGIVHCGAENVLPFGLVIVPNSTYASNTAWWDLEGYDQMIDRVSGTFRNTGLRSAQAASLWMYASGDGNFAGPIDGALSLVWNPEDAESVFDYSGTGTTTGDLTINSGTFLISGSGSLPNVKNITVGYNGTLSLTTDAEGALADARHLDLCGTLSVSAASTSPFEKLQIDLDANGSIQVPDGTVLTVASVKRNGQYLDDALYTSGWVTGGGTVRIDSTLIYGDNFVWRNAVDGLWDDGDNWFAGFAPNGEHPVQIFADGSDYTIGVPNGTILAPSLAIGGQNTAIATMSPTGTVTVADGATISLLKNGRIEVPADSTLDFAVNPSVDNNDSVVSIGNGGELAVTGGEVTGEEFHGQFLIGDGGKLSVSSGSFELTPYMSGGATYVSAVKLADGGEMELSGTGVFFPHFANYQGYPFVMEGGSFTATGSSRFIVDPTRSKDLEGFLFGAGEAVFKGDSVLVSDGNAAPSLKFVTFTADSTCRIKTAENGAICLTNGTVMVGTSTWKSPADCKAEMVFDSAAESWLGGRCYLGYATRNGAESTITVKRGALRLGGDGLYASTVANGINYTCDSLASTVNVEGGVFSISGINAGLGEAYYSSLMLGNSLPEGSWSSAAKQPLATVNLTGGVLSNDYGRIAFGTGSATGRVVQAGGEFRSCSRAPAFFGVYDGVGSYTMSGGTAKLAETVYLGLAASITSLPVGSWNKLSLGTHVNGSAARGIIDVEGGVFETAGDVIAGTDGTYGEVTVGAAGTFKAHDLKVLGSNCRLAVKVGTQGCGSIRLSGELDLAEGVKIELVGAQAVENEPIRCDLITFGSCGKTLTRSDFTGLPASWSFQQKATSIRISSPTASSSGSVLIFQ